MVWGRGAEKPFFYIISFGAEREFRCGLPGGTGVADIEQAGGRIRDRQDKGPLLVRQVLLARAGILQVDDVGMFLAAIVIERPAEFRRWRPHRAIHLILVIVERLRLLC